MDTILRDVPMPKIFIASSIKEGRTYRVVIDGQQRISAILAFLRNDFALDEPYRGKAKGKHFCDLDQRTQNRILSYQIDFNEAINPSDKEIREVYARVNKYTVPLTKQELRRADFPGDFLNISEELAINEYFDRAGLFSPANRKRSADVEYVSELLAAMIDGVQDKKGSLDSFYIRFAKWKKHEKNRIVERFSKSLEEIATISRNGPFAVSETRFRQKADFYTLFLAVDAFVSEGKTLKGKELDPLRQDLMIMDDHIRPESPIEIFREYAIKCVSQANSLSSRRWRFRFLRPILAGSFVGGQPDGEGAVVFYRLMDALSKNHSLGMCPEPVFECAICEREIESVTDDGVLAWNRRATVNQVSNLEWIHRTCIDAAGQWLVLERPSDDQSSLF